MAFHPQLSAVIRGKIRLEGFWFLLFAKEANLLTKRRMIMYYLNPYSLRFYDRFDSGREQ
jgi:hypothetical protein